MGSPGASFDGAPAPPRAAGGGSDRVGRPHPSADILRQTEACFQHHLVARRMHVVKPVIMWRPNRQQPLPWVEVLLASTLVLNLFDTALTLLVVETGLAAEANPVMAAAFEHGPEVFGIAKITMVSLGVWVLWRHRDRVLAMVGSTVACAAYVGVAAYHVRSVQALAALATAS